MKLALALIAAMIACAPAALAAREVAVSVDARAQPWDVDANKQMKFGKGDGGAPVVVLGFEDMAGANVAIFPLADGVTTVDGQQVGPEGVVGDVADDLRMKKKRVYPSLYTPKVLYPVYRHALMAVFTDGEGHLVGRPFPVGSGVRVGVPDDAFALNLGFNDITSEGNAGFMTVVVEIPDD